MTRAKVDHKVFAVVIRGEKQTIKDHLIGWRDTEKQAEDFRQNLIDNRYVRLGDEELEIVALNDVDVLDALHSTALSRRLPRWKEPKP